MADLLIACTCGGAMCFDELRGSQNPLTQSNRDTFYIRVVNGQPHWFDDLGNDSGIVCEGDPGGDTCSIAVFNPDRNRIEPLTPGPDGHFLTIDSAGIAWSTAIGQSIVRASGWLLLAPNVPMACPEFLTNNQIRPGRVTLERATSEAPTITYP